MKSDIQLKCDVEEELQWDPAVDADRFAVAVKNGVVTISGGIDTFAGKHAVEEAIRRVAGVTALVVHVDVHVPADMRRPDEEIAQAIGDALRWNTSVPADTIRVTVEDGAVTLRGEVDQDFQRRAALDTVQRVRGVTSVANALTLRDAVGPADLSERINKALQRQAALDASRITVKVTNGTVTLSGPLRNINECRIAREAAWDAPGVRAVIDNMWVGT
ncbi:BON domain-containing protein [Ralstonia pseudosolanacearum]|uniref:BON domain-containing protein n=2 Tax=Ralstonia solanacearum species complex TaxID=3116862 RepID=A0A0S4WPN1_RALSL|nr:MULTISPECIES: BON domain-containing protein [Ralstonia]AUS44072.1 BON domain-containing protein [Ralstonia solanacearum]AVV68250.1 BON domain-containing protein [Ralstonia solanacearum OE1-1]API76549.1 transporter [Ralstonia pseudosolanacearum]ASL75329.1 transporter [Ralstonia pseudosolanacearum]AST88211.1 BON domain-containing protein [Ralstonia pseudosolanacearum]